MSDSITPVTQNEVLPHYTKGDVDKIERRAIMLLGRTEHSAAMFSIDLRRLQDANAHLMRGYSSFGTYVERTFEGIRANNARQISNQGKVLLILSDRGRINLDLKTPVLPGTTGIRALSALWKQFGEDAMLSIYDRAMESGRKVTDEVVAAAARELVEPLAPHELGVGSVEPIEDDEDDDNEPMSEKQRHLLDRLQEAREHLDDLADNVMEGKKMADVEVFLQNMMEQ